MTAGTPRAALYARVSTDGQAKDRTIDSQLDALRGRAQDDGLTLAPDLRFVDDGYSGSTLIRPALERLRDAAAVGGFDRLYVHSPDRLARSYVYQMLLVDELRRAGVEIVFLNRSLGQSPEDQLLLQMQGMMAEYERAKILERSRRGKLHAARAGRVSAFGKAPYGYRYVSKADGGGSARWEVHSEEAAVVRLIFQWMGVNGYSLAEIGRRLRDQGIRTQTGRTVWLSRTLWGILMNEAYIGTAYFNKTTAIARRTRHRPNRGQPEHPRRVRSLRTTPQADQVPVPVPALVDPTVFHAARERLAENRKRKRRPEPGVRYLLQGLIVCRGCGYAFCGQTTTRTRAGRVGPTYQYYLCTGSMFGRCDRERVCWTRSVRMAELDAAVWDDVREVLTDPTRIEAEYRRRCDGNPAGRAETGESPDRLVEAARRRVARLVDAYEDGLLAKSEFEPRVRGARDRLAQLEADAAAERDRQATEADLRDLLGRLDEFARRVRTGLKDADVATRREIIRTLVKRIEVGEEEVRVVYKVNPFPFADRPDHARGRGGFQDRVRRTGATSSR